MLGREDEVVTWELAGELGVVVNTAISFGQWVTQFVQASQDDESGAKNARMALQWIAGFGHGIGTYLDKIAPQAAELNITMPTWPNPDDYRSAFYTRAQDPEPWTAERLKSDREMFQAGIEQLLGAVQKAIGSRDGARAEAIFELALTTKVFSPGDKNTKELTELAQKAELPEGIWQDLIPGIGTTKDQDTSGKLWDQLSQRVRRYLLHGTIGQNEPEENAGDQPQSGLL